MVEYYKTYTNLGINKSCSKNGTVYDFFREKIFEIPNEILILLTKEYFSFSDFKSIFSNEKICNQYLTYLLDNEIIFKTNNPENFPNLNVNIEYSSLIDMLFICFDDKVNQKLDFLKNNLKQLGAYHIMLILDKGLKEEHLSLIIEIIKIINDTRVQHLTFFVKYDENKVLNQESIVKKVIKISNRIREIIFYNCNFEKSNKNIHFFKTNLQNLLYRPIKSIADFNLDLHMYLEAHNFNIYFNRKIFICNEGFIKHNLFDDKNYLNIDNFNIEALIKSGYTDLWGLNKNQINECNQCKYNLICPDPRIPFYDDSEKSYKHKTKCTYDPINDLWNN